MILDATFLQTNQHVSLTSLQCQLDQTSENTETQVIWFQMVQKRQELEMQIDHRDRKTKDALTLKNVGK